MWRLSDRRALGLGEDVLDTLNLTGLTGSLHATVWGMWEAAVYNYIHVF